jgi:uncharacterized phage infection (PIP) family protein YhgE
MPITQYRTGRVIAAAAILPAMLFAVSSTATSARAADATTSSSNSSHQAAASKDRIEERITDLHKKLHVTADQQGLWDDMAQVMRANAQKMRDNVADRTANLKSMNAVDDLRSYQKITDEHADGLKRLIPSFEALYAKMSPAQQKNADRVFGEQQRHTVHQS